MLTALTRACGPAWRPLSKVLLSALILVALGGSCSERSQRTAGSDEARLPKPTLRLLVMTDIKGYLEPCGCTSRPLGGVDRMAALVKRLRADGAPTLMVATGDLLFGEAYDRGLTGDAVTQEIWKAETLVEVMNRVGVTAAAPGKRDLALGLETFERVKRAARFPWLAAGLARTESATTTEPMFGNEIVHRAGSLRVGIFGVSEVANESGALPEGLTQTQPSIDAARASAQRLRQQRVDVIVALVNGSRRTARAVANDVEGVTFVVQGGIDRGEPIPPIEVGNAHIVHAGYQGQGVLELFVYRKGPGAFADASEWTRRVERERLLAGAKELRQRIAAWERSKSVDASDLRIQRNRLAEMERDAERANNAPPVTQRNTFVARLHELPPEAPADESMAAVLDAYDVRVNEHNKRVFANLVPRPAEPGQPTYVGSARCTSCHSAAVAWWRTTPHGRAYRTLVVRHKEFNLNCVGCHVTGYMKPGGSTVTHNEGLVNVGCESCHGAGSAHVANPRTELANVERAVPETTCVQCHNPEHSDRFEYNAYRNLLIVPGHGLPAQEGS